MVEAALVLMTFLALAISVLDFGQVMITHHMMVERVRNSLRWAVTQPYDGTGDQIRNMILYNQPTMPVGVHTTQTFLNLTTSNIQVNYTAPDSTNPNDERVFVAVVNYPYQFVSPWIAKAVTGARPVVQSAAMIYKP